MMIKSKMDEINSMDIMCATEVEEFFSLPVSAFKYSLYVQFLTDISSI